MGNSISQDSYLNPTTCGGRNITWAYLKYNGTLPSPYAECGNAARVLKLHCCEEGLCRPSALDHEFDKYDWYDWNGLGWPYTEGDGKVVVGGKKNGKGCKPPFIRRGLGLAGRRGEGVEGEVGMGNSGFAIGAGGFEYPYQQTIDAPIGGMDPGVPVFIIIGIVLGGSLLAWLIYLLVLLGRKLKRARSVESLGNGAMAESKEE